jgi:hypothetical protein
VSRGHYEIYCPARRVDSTSLAVEDATTALELFVLIPCVAKHALRDAPLSMMTKGQIVYT